MPICWTAHTTMGLQLVLDMSCGQPAKKNLHTFSGRLVRPRAPSMLTMLNQSHILSLHFFLVFTSSCSPEIRHERFNTGLAKKFRKASAIRLLSVFTHRCLRQCSHRCAGSTRIPRIHPDPPGGSVPLFRIHRQSLYQNAETAFWATFNYIILIVRSPSNHFRILWGAGG